MREEEKSSGCVIDQPTAISLRSLLNPSARLPPESSRSLVLAVYSGVMKRGRDQTPEEEPLTKRINNLHLDNAAASQMLSQVLNGSALLPSSVPALDQERLLNGLAAAASLPECSMAQASASLPGVGHASAGPGHGVSPQDMSELEEMISRRELPDSLSVTYPNLNPTNNHQYFAFNKLLHHLHLERLRRAGKLSH
ncbi:hypothetical protein GWK47_046291 [Chionoecetes opilio]|uniref:Uncharacterized protein n=1 Tax=Chionoecetes opilio TaxID=41210 RepID=A0A8J4YE27_CHIOP|nr:hypothetical protein GWK47_046291 [Chionoecetes opilio]